MKRLLIALLVSAAPVAAFATCGNVYDPMNHQWVYACGAGNNFPQCHQEYDPMNHRWVTVCH